MKGKLSISKIFNFEMAHAIHEYVGLCAHLHGHSYRLEIAVCAETLDSLGMITDFSKLKSIVQEHLISKVDHALVLSNKSDAKLVEELKKHHNKLHLVDFNPTNENLVMWFVDILEKPLSNLGLVLCKLKLYETASSYAEWEL